MNLDELLRRKPVSYVCLDFGRDQLSAIEVVDGTVTRWTAEPLAPGIFRNGDPLHPPVLGEEIRRTLTRAGIESRTARMALPDEATVSRHLTLPPMPQRDLVRAMHFAAERHIPFAISRACWSWDLVERSPDHISVYLVAAWRDVVERYGDAARAAGLVPKVLEPRSIAVARALDQDEALLVDAGASRLHVTLLVGGQPAFVDEAAAGGSDQERQEALDRLLQRAFRFQSTAPGASGRLAPVLLAGEMEQAELSLPVDGRQVTEVLNGHLPAAPREFRVGGQLANLGLSMRSGR